MKKIINFLQNRKYELLLVALIQHLFIGIFINELSFYTTVIWPINMFILGVLSIGVFIKKGRWKNIARNILFIIVLGLPIGLTLFRDIPHYFQALNMMYVLYFMFIFWEVMLFLIKPGYINTDIISAAACGYFLLIEIGVFLFQFIHYSNPLSFKGISNGDPANTYMDLVYFCSITMTSIGYGDITPNLHIAKLLTSIYGIAGQFYSVVLVGIIISKFTSNSEK
ncbi:MAG: potassium channel family protein [Siphonobacter sp.]